MPKNLLNNDLFKTVRYIGLVKLLTYLDFKRKYRRSLIGPFWSVISISLTIAIISLVFGKFTLGGIGNPLLFIASGLILWNLISVCINESCDSLILNESIIRQSRIPFYVFSLRLVARNTVFLLHNIIIIPIVFLIAPFDICWSQLLIIPGILILILNIFFISIIISIFSTRFRDFGQLISNALPLLFYATPIIWSIDNAIVGGRLIEILKLNPLMYFFDIVRSPLLCTNYQDISLNVVILFSIANLLFSYLIYERYKDKISYWL